MGPKVESVLRFLESGGKQAVITSYEHLCEAIDGNAGTSIYPDAAALERAHAVHAAAPVGGR
jgi:hypothetical protein